jgi:hypothetical protein
MHLRHSLVVCVSVLDYDDTVPSLLMGPIGAKFFGIQPKSNPMMSMLQHMLA